MAKTYVARCIRQGSKYSLKCLLGKAAVAWHFFTFLKSVSEGNITGITYMLFGKGKGFVLTLEGEEYWLMFFVQMGDYMTFLFSLACFSRPA